MTSKPLPGAEPLESVTLCRGAIYRHIRKPELICPLSCPECHGAEVEFHSSRERIVEHVDAERPCYLVLTLSKYRCPQPGCHRKYFTPPVAEASVGARTSSLLQGVAKGMYRSGKGSLRAVEADMRGLFHTGTGKTSILRWHSEDLVGDYPKAEALSFSRVLCIDEVYDRVDGKRRPIFTCVDPIAGITVRIEAERADGEHLARAMGELKALGADPEVVVSDLWSAYPEALKRVWPKAERQLCWFHVQQWMTRKLSSLLKEYGESLPQEKRKRLFKLRFRLLAGPGKQAKFSEKDRAQLAEAWDIIAGTIVEEAIRLRDELRTVLNQSKSKGDARWAFDKLRQAWPERFGPWTWRPGQEIPEPKAEGEGLEPEGLASYLYQIMAFFVLHFEMMTTYLGRPGVPRTSNHAERANRKYRAVSRVRYGWKTDLGLRAFLISMQGFDSS